MTTTCERRYTFPFVAAELWYDTAVYAKSTKYFPIFGAKRESPGWEWWHLPGLVMGRQCEPGRAGPDR